MIGLVKYYNLPRYIMWSKQCHKPPIWERIWQLMMVKLGMVYYCFTHIIPLPCLSTESYHAILLDTPFRPANNSWKVPLLVCVEHEMTHNMGINHCRFFRCSRLAAEWKCPWAEHESTRNCSMSFHATSSTINFSCFLRSLAPSGWPHVAAKLSPRMLPVVSSSASADERSEALDTQVGAWWPVVPIEIGGTLW
jgi:hypothetical protein